MATRAKRVAATIQGSVGTGELPLTAVFAHRSETAYAAVLGNIDGWPWLCAVEPELPCRANTADAGKIDVPLHGGGRCSEPQLEPLLAGMETPLLILCPDRSDVRQLAAKFPAHRILGANGLTHADDGARSMQRQIRSLISSLHREARDNRKA